MDTIKQILVPVDFSPDSQPVLEYAVSLADRFGAAIRVLHVLETPVYGWAPIVPTAMSATQMSTSERSDANDRMRQLVSVCAAITKANIEGHIETGDPCDTILKTAEEAHFDIIVMGASGRTGMSHLLRGSLAEAVVRRAPCAVLTIRNFQAPHREADRSRADATDHSPSSRQTGA